MKNQAYLIRGVLKKGNRSFFAILDRAAMNFENNCSILMLRDNVRTVDRSNNKMRWSSNVPNSSLSVKLLTFKFKQIT